VHIYIYIYIYDTCAALRRRLALAGSKKEVSYLFFVNAAISGSSNDITFRSCGLLQCVAVRCSRLQCVAVCVSVCVAVSSHAARMTSP